MADTTKEILSRITLDFSSWKSAVDSMRALMKQAAAEDQARTSAQKSAADALLAAANKELEIIQKLNAASKDTVSTQAAKTSAVKATADAAAKAAAAQRAAEEKLGQDTVAIINRTEQTRRKEQQQSAAEQRKLDAENHRKKIEEAHAEVLAQREEAREAAKEAKEAAERPSIKRLLAGPAQTVAGGKGTALGGIAGALLSGGEIGVGIAAFEGLEGAIDKVIDKIKEFVEDSGGLQKVTETFQNLSAGKGYDSGEFIEELVTKTNHLVTEVDLLREANTFMQSGLKVSKEDMIELTEATVGLARGQGKDATQAVQALTRTFLTGGRGAMQLARVVGIQGPELMMRGFAATETMAQRQEETFTRLKDVILKRYEEMGQPALTYTDRLKQINVVSTELYEKLAQGAVKSAGFGTLMSALGTAINTMGSLGTTAEKVGEMIGNAFTPVATIFETLLPTVKDVGKVFLDVARSVNDLFSMFAGGANPVDKMSQSFSNLHPILNLVMKSLEVVAGTISTIAINASTLTQIADKAIKGVGTPGLDSPEYAQWRQQKGLAPARQTFDGSFLQRQRAASQQQGEYNQFSSEYDKGPSFADIFNSAKQQLAELDQRTQATDSSLQSTFLSLDDPKNKGKGVNPSNQINDDALNRRNAQRLSQEEFQLTLRQSQEALAVAKDNIAAESEANEAAYKSGTVAAKDYYQNKIKFAEETRAATIKNIDEEEAARKKQDADKLKFGEITPADLKVKNKSEDIDTQRKRIDANKTFAQALSSANISSQEEADKITKENIQNDLKAKTDATELAKSATVNAYKEQTISAQEYYEASLAYINKERDDKISAAQQEIAVNGPLADSNIALYQQIKEAANQATLATQALNQAKIETAIQDINARHQGAVGLLTAQQTGQSSPLSTASPEDQLALQNQLYDEAVNHVTELNNQLASTDSKTYYKTWLDITTQIQQANNELDQIVQKQQQLANSASLIGQAATLAGASGSGFGNIFGGRYAKGVESALSGGASSAQSAQGFVNTASSSFSSAFSTLGGSGSSSSIFGGPLLDSLGQFTKGLTAAIGAVSSFASAVANAGSASAGALGGGLSGGGLGASVGSAFSPAGAAIGAGIGVALGAVTGGLIGQKQEETQDDINQLSANFKGIMNQYSANNSSLANTIASLTVLVAQAQAQQASTKKGGSQFTSLIQQYNSQIVQLEDQQTQIMQQLNQQLLTASSPIAYQQIISSVQQILQQYTSFVGAAQNATQLAQANEYLTQSLQNLAVGYSDQVNQGQQQAIEDALNLNQLYNQRNQLEYQYLQQVQSIEGQGTLTRGVTQSQSKYSQLFNLDVSTSNQLLNINAQINLAQYQVTAAQQIFNLATTQVGLQTQLLQLQEVGINEDMARLAAMQNVLAVLQQTGYSLTNLGSLDTSDPNALLTLLLQLLASQLGINVGQVNNPTGVKALDVASAGAYSARASYGYGGFRSANI